MIIGDKQTKTGNSNSGVSTSVLALSVVIALLVGLISGYFFGENRTSSRYQDEINRYYTSAGNQNNPNQNISDNSSTGDDTTDPYAGDYTQYKINDNHTVQSYYSDNETRYYAANLIGQTLPEIKWTDSAGMEHSTAEYAEGKYILELFSSTCAYCKASASEIDKYRESSGNKIVSLCLDDGDLANFNQTGEHAWKLTNDAETSVQNILGNVPWIPCFLYVENNTVRLVTFGGTTEAQIRTEWADAFGG